MKASVQGFERTGGSVTERSGACGRAPGARLAGILAGVIALSVLPGCPTQGNLGELTFEQIDDVAYGRTFDSENGDGYMDEGRWAAGSSLRIRIDTADPGAALPLLSCAAENPAVFDVVMEGADVVNVYPLAQGETLLRCLDSGTQEVIDYIAMAAGVPASLAAWYRTPWWITSFVIDAGAAPLTLIAGGGVDMGVEVLDASGGHLRGNEDLVPVSDDVGVANVYCDAGLGCLSNHFNVVGAVAVGSATIDYSLSSDPAVYATVAVDVVDPAIDLSALGYRFIDPADNPLAPGAPVPDGSLLIINAFLQDGTTEAWGGDYSFTIGTATTIALSDPVPATVTSYAVYVDALQSGAASVTVDLLGGALSAQIDFDVVAN